MQAKVSRYVILCCDPFTSGLPPLPHLKLGCALIIDLLRYLSGGDLLRGPYNNLCKEHSCLHNLSERWFTPILGRIDTGGPEMIATFPQPHLDYARWHNGKR